MTEIIVALIAAAGGAAVVAIPAIRAIRSQPTRRTTDAISLVDASGTVIGNLTDEINRLETLVDEARAEAKACRDESRLIKAELERRPTRDELLEQIEKLRQQVRGLGATPKNGP